MAEDGEPKGTVTSLGSLFSAADALKAAGRVQGAIAERRREVDRLLAFAADNANLVNLVQRLPDELSHDIMVPFGGAAFFPGRLIHTNELLVLLGEGYYAERTSKQTVEILQRRGKVLEALVDSLKATMLDLEAEANFFDTAASEAAQGIVEIREDYVEERSINQSKSGVSESIFQGASKADKLKVSAKDEEYAQIMARLDELEKQELAEEEASSDREELDEDEKEELARDVSGSGNDVANTVDFDSNMTRHKFDGYLSEAFEKHKFEEPVENSRLKVPYSSTTREQIGGPLRQDHDDRTSVMDSNRNFVVKDVTSIRDLEEQPETSKTPILKSTSKENLHKTLVANVEDFSEYIGSQTSEVASGSHMAFTGSIVEHSHVPPINSTKSSSSHQASGSNPAKPVSRFKMQRGGR